MTSPKPYANDQGPYINGVGMRRVYRVKHIVQITQVSRPREQKEFARSSKLRSLPKLGVNHELVSKP